MDTKEITLSSGDKVLKSNYIRLKTKDLIEFGYSNLTEQEVSEQVLTVEKFQMELQMLAQDMKHLETRQASLMDIINKFQVASKA
jgi:hypothetical protein